MKNYLFLVLAITFTLTIKAQTPQSFQYQAVVRNSVGNIFISQPINFRMSIISGALPGIIEYSETHNVTSNAFGIVTLSVGNGTPVTNLFSNINWSVSTHYLKIEMDTTTSGSYFDLGTLQLLSVPYALHSQTTDTAAAANSLTGHYIGELFGGGIVFWVDHSKQHGLIASITDVNTGTQWSNVINTQIGPTAQSTWNGQQNTQAIISQPGHVNSGALFCTQYSHDGFSDWYLPSSYELRQLLVNAFEITSILENDNDVNTTGLFIPSSTTYYMSSTEQLNNSNYVFVDMSTHPGNIKDGYYRVRAIRKF